MTLDTPASVYQALVARTDKRPARILFVITSSDVGGAESIVRELALRLDRRHLDPILCSLRPCGRMAVEVGASGTRVFSLQMSEQPKIHEIIGGMIALARWIDHNEVDIVHSFLYRANVIARLACRVSRRRPVSISGHHTLTPLGGRRATLGSVCTRRLSDRIVAVSEAVKNELIQTERVDPERIVVIANGVDTTRYVPRDGSLLRSHFGIHQGAIVVGAVGRLSPEKGHRHLLKSAALLRTRGVRLHLLLIGDGPERDGLEHDTRRLCLDSQVQFLGMRTELSEIYPVMDVFALPSLEEAAPTALLEAMASGRAVIATAIGGSLEMIEHGRSGLLVEPGSPSALAEALQSLAADPTLRERLGVEARRRALARFDVSRMVERHTSLYRDVLLARGQTNGSRWMFKSAL